MWLVPNYFNLIYVDSSPNTIPEIVIVVIEMQ